MKPIKARVSKQGFMGSASREHKVKKGKGSYRRREKHQKKNW
jgi:stalled ribosome alternative rescue factor ArfA